MASTCSDIPGRLFDRPPLSIDVERGGVELTVFSNHFASKSGQQPGLPRRAGGVRRRARPRRSRTAGGEVLVAGDLNDFEDEGAPTTLGETLNPLWGLAPAEERYSFQFSGRLQTLDHMFVSDGLLDRVRDFTYAHFDNDYFERPDPDRRPPRLRPRSAGRDAAGRRSRRRRRRTTSPRRRSPAGTRWLVGLPGEWRDADEFAYRWLRCPTTALSSCALIRGATAPRLPRAARRPPALPALRGDRDGRRRHDGRVVGARVGERLVGRAQPATRTASPSAIRPGVVTRALIPNSVSCRVARWRSSCGHLRLRGGIAGRDRAALARVQQLGDDAARELEPPALPAVLGPRLAVEDDVDVRAEAAQVELRAELLAERDPRRLDRDQQRCGRDPGCRRGRGRSRTGRPRSAARSSARPSSSQPATRPSGAVSRANGGAAGSSVAPSSA